MKKLLAFCLLLFACAAWAQKINPADQLDAARKGIAETNRRAIEAAKSKDAEAEASVYAEDSILMPPGEPPVVGHKAIVAFFRKMYAGNGVLSAQENRPIDLVLLSDGLAVEIACFHGTVREPGKPDSQFKGKSTILYKRQPDGSWKMFRDMWDIMP